MTALGRAGATGLVLAAASAAAHCGSGGDAQQSSTLTAVPSEADRLLASIVDGCSMQLLTDMQQVPTKEDEYGGGVMCAAPATDLSKITIERYRPGSPVAVAYLDVEGGDDGYKGNRFRTGRNCIYIQAKGKDTPASIADLRAYVELKPVARGAGCAPMTKSAKKIRLSSIHRDNPADIPPNVRIDMNYGGYSIIAGRRIVVGFKCLPTEWCEVSRRRARPPHNEVGTPSHDIPGWYDEQYLSIADGGALRPTNVYASIYPHSEMSRVMADDASGLWMQAAEIRFRTEEDVDADEFRAVMNRYKSKWGLGKYPDDIELTDTVRIRLLSQRRGSATIWAAQYTIRNFKGSVRKVDFHPDSRAFLDSPGLLPALFPATRWAWDPDDEKSWMRCSVGCCSVTETDITLDLLPFPLPADT